MQHNCQTCHGATPENRNGAPKEVVFDRHEAVCVRRAEILSQISGPEPLMPPSGGLDADELWLECFESWVHEAASHTRDDTVFCGSTFGI